MALADSRVVLKQGSTLTDLSAESSDLFAGSAVFPVIASQDNIFFGSDSPFNHRFLFVDSPNTNTSRISAIDIWNGSDWSPCVDIIDRTSVGGITLAQNGVLEWMPQRNVLWQKAASTEFIPSLVTLKIYDKYWARITFDNDLDIATSLKYVGQRFSSDNDLAAYYPDLLRSNVIDAFKTGKTDWNDQHVLAAEEVIDDLKKDLLLWTSGQVLDWQRFTRPAVHKVAEIIMRSFGDDYQDQKAVALRDYMKSLERTGAGLDCRGDGRLTTDEKKPIKRLIRI